MIPILSNVYSCMYNAAQQNKKLKRKNELKKNAVPGIKALVLSPTRELSEQTFREAQRFIAETGEHNVQKLKLSVLTKSLTSKAVERQVLTQHLNGKPVVTFYQLIIQDKSVLAKIDILFTTPMRLQTLIRAKAVELNSVKLVGDKINYQ